MGSFSLKIKTKQGQHIITDFNGDTTVLKLKESLSKLTNIKVNELYLLIGFPPKPLDLTNHTKSLAFYGITNGDTIIVNEKQQQAGNDNKKSYIEDDELLAKCLAAEEQRSLGNSNITGPTSLPIPTIINENSAPLINSDLENKSTEKGILLKQVVPSDNSCLFTSIGYVLSGKIDTSCGTVMREIIAQHVSNDKELYNEAILGKPNIEYSEWIRKSESWGGAIEVSILSGFYGIEIDVVDITNALINRFGEDKQFGIRVFLLFDGIHYDPLYLESLTVIIYFFYSFSYSIKYKQYKLDLYIRFHH